jgi:hypothetical protein
MHYAVLYDITDYNPIPYLLTFIALYLIIVMFGIRAANHGQLFRLFATSGGAVWLLALCVGLLVTIIASSQILIYTIYFRALSQGHYRIVEGSVEEFSPRPIHGHGAGTFTVDGVWFHYVENDLTAALQQSRPPLQSLQNGSYVRVTYMRDYGTVYVGESTFYDLQILRLEILQKPEPSPTEQPAHSLRTPTPPSPFCPPWCYNP